MNKEELSILSRQKTFEGKSPKQINIEIKNLIKSQKLFTLNKREIKSLNTLIKNQAKEIKQLKKKVNKKQTKTLVKGLGQDPADNKKQSNGIFANTAHLKRILLFIGEQESPVNITTITKNCVVTNGQAKSGLRFLLKHNLIQTNRGAYFV